MSNIKFSLNTLIGSASLVPVAFGGDGGEPDRG